MKGEEDKLFDEFLRKTVGNYQVKPSPAIWKGILQKVPAKGIGRIPFSGGNSGLIGFISGGIIISSVAVYNYNSNKHHKTEPQGTLTAQTISHNSKDSIDSTTFVYNNAIQQAKEVTTPETKNDNNNINEGNTQINESPVTKVKSKKINPVTTAFLEKNTTTPLEKSLKETAVEELQSTAAAEINKETSKKEDNSLVLATTSEKSSVLADLKLINSNKTYYFNLADKTKQQSSLITDPLRQNPRTMKISKWEGDYAGNNAPFAAGVYYQPEWLSNAQNSKFGTTRQSGGLILNWKKRPFIIETGIGAMKEQAYQDYDVTYKQLLGTYNNLQSVTFDTIGGVIVPHYHYVVDSVFDPNEKKQNHSELASYTYLQIPLNIGLEKSFGRSSFSIKAGPVFSLLIDKTENKLVIDPDKHIITIEGDHPDRLRTSWQWYVGLGYSYAITDKISFFLEPSLRGYLNTPYERKRKPNENPLYVGVRTGVTIQFKNPFSK